MTSMDISPPASWNDPERFLALMDSQWGRTIVGLQDVISTATALFWREEGVRAIHLPVTTSAVSSPMGLGSDSLPVATELFGVKTYLADSMQFSLEYGCRLSPAGCYYLMPSFRGEAPDSTHLCQFFHSEAELAGGLDLVMSTVERYLQRIATELLSTDDRVLIDALGPIEHVSAFAELSKDFQRITFDEAAALLANDSNGIRIGESHGRQWRSLTRHGEQRLLAYFNEPIWVTHFDHLATPFYQAFDHGTGKALNADLLLGIGEVVGAGERHEHAKDVRRSLELHHVDPKPYEWYIQMREKRPMRTAGFGLGTERLLMWLLNHDDIRDLQLFPRVNGQVSVP